MCELLQSDAQMSSLHAVQSVPDNHYENSHPLHVEIPPQLHTRNSCSSQVRVLIWPPLEGAPTPNQEAAHPGSAPLTETLV